MTTTGFGDITLPGPLGKLTSVVTMIVGISLFGQARAVDRATNKVAYLVRNVDCKDMRSTPFTAKLAAFADIPNDND